MLIFLHVPKSAGTSIRIFLWEALDRERVFWHGEDGFLEDVIRAKGVEHFERYAAVGGHIMFSHTDLMRLPGEKLFAAVVRNPLHQVVSHYEFVRNQPAHPYHTDLPLEKALTSHTAFVQASRNMQCRYIASQHTFANAMKVIKANPFAIGSYDQLDLFVDYICSYLDIPKLSLPHENTQQPSYP